MVTCGEPSADAVRTEVINVVDDSVVCADLEDYPAVQSYPPLGGVVDGMKRAETSVKALTNNRAKHFFELHPKMVSFSQL